MENQKYVGAQSVFMTKRKELFVHMLKPFPHGTPTKENKRKAQNSDLRSDEDIGGDTDLTPLAPCSIRVYFYTRSLTPLCISSQLVVRTEDMSTWVAITGKPDLDSWDGGRGKRWVGGRQGERRRTKKERVMSERSRSPRLASWWQQVKTLTGVWERRGVRTGL